MGQLATMVFTTRAGSQLSLEPHSGKTGAVGIFMPREGVDQFFPLPKYTEQYAGSPDTEGARRILSQTENASGTGTVVVAGDDEVSFHTWHQRWQEFVEEMRREGGTLMYTPAEGVAVTYEVESMKITAAKYDGVMMLAFVQEFEFEFTCRPYGLLSSEEQTLRDHDPFTRDTIGAGEWAAFDNGSGTLTIENGQLVPTTAAAEKAAYRYGLKTSNAQASIMVTTGASAASGLAGVYMKRLDASNSIRGVLNITGGASNLEIRKADEGVGSSLKASGSFTVAANTTYWIRMTTTDNVVTLELFTSSPDTGVAATQSISYTLAGADATKFGLGVWGNAGMRMVPAGTDYRFDEWRWDAKQFRASSPLADFELPGVKGHVEALGELTYTDMSNQSRRYADYGLEKGGSFVPTVSPPNIVDSDQMVTAGFSGAQATRTGAYDPLASGNNVVRATLSSFPTVVCSTGPQKHVGPYRIKARVHVDPREPGLAVGPAYARFAVSGSSAGPFTKGKWARVPVTESWCDVDLGVVESALARAGNQSWEVRLEVLSESAGDTIDVDYIEFFGASKYAKVKDTGVYETPTLVTAQDQFNQTPEGAIAGKVIGNAAGEAQSKNPTLQANGTEVQAAWSATGATGAPNGTTSSTFVESASVENSSTKSLILYKDVFSIPESATIRGIKVEVTKMAPTGGMEATDKEVRLGTAKSGTAAEQGGENKASAGVWPKSLAVSSYGGESDLWGKSWTPAQINSEGFSFWLRAQSKSGNGAVYVDGIVVTVYYTPSGGIVWKEAGAKEPKFTLKTGTKLVERAGTGTDESNKGRKMWVPGEFTSQAVQAELTPTGEGGLGVMTRFKESPDQRVAAILNVVGGFYTVRVIKWTGSVATELQKPLTGIKLSKVSGQTVLLRLQVEADGRWVVWADGLVVGQGYDKTLSEGELAKGASGVYSVCSGGTFSHKIDNFVCWTPEFRASLWAGRSLQFRSRDAIKENNEGGSWSPAFGYEGARLRVPPAGPAGLTSRLNVRSRRTNIDESIDEWISDEMQVSLQVTPRVVLLG